MTQGTRPPTPTSAPTTIDNLNSKDVMLHQSSGGEAGPMSTEIVTVKPRQLARTGLDRLPAVPRVLHREHQEQEHTRLAYRPDRRSPRGGHA